MGQQISLRQALIHAKGREIKEDYMTYWKDKAASATVFTDGTVLIAQSEYDEDYSEVTPGNGIEPPSFYLLCDVDTVPEICS